MTARVGVLLLDGLHEGAHGAHVAGLQLLVQAVAREEGGGDVVGEDGEQLQVAVRGRACARRAGRRRGCR